VIQQNDKKIVEADEDLEDIESYLDEEEMLRMERENDHFSLWLGGYFLPLMMRICAVLFALLTVVQLTIRFPKLIPWVIGGMIGLGVTLVALWAFSMALISAHRKRRKHDNQAD
jgi:hypothetical protein